MSSHKAEPGALKAALVAAEQMRLKNTDPAGVAHWLLRVHRRSRDLEDLLQVTDRYLRFGMPEHELSEMRRLVSRLRESELTAEDSDEVDSTLPI